MTCLSRLVLNPRNHEVRQDLADCQKLHRRVLSAFPHVEEASARDALGVLFRVDIDRRGGTSVLVQSEAEPDWSRLPPGYLATPSASKRIDGAYEGIGAGTILNFRLRANPTKRLGKSAGLDAGKRVELRREEEQIGWLARKGYDGGFELASVRASPGLGASEAVATPDVRAVPADNVHGQHRQKDDNAGRLTFGSVLFEGELRVTDANRFRRTLRVGVGSGKAYGFGLLSIAPARSPAQVMT